MHNKTIEKALKIMESEFVACGEKYNSSQKIKDYCRLQIGAEKEEIFAVVFMNTQFELLGFVKLFRGSVSQSVVPPRAIARHMFELNAARMILVHNHPSGTHIPSEADLKLTKELKELFDKLDCKIVDHIIVSALGSYSMAENGNIF